MRDEHKFWADERKIKKVLQKAIDNINWKKHGFKKRGTLQRSTGVSLISEDGDFQLFADISGSPR